MPELQAVIFDLDGTLIDSATDITAAVNKLLTKYERPHVGVDQIRGMVGDGAPILLRRVFEATGAPLDPDQAPKIYDDFLHFYERESASPDQIFPGVLETLDLLLARGLRLGLCTNKPETVTREVLGQLDLARYFGSVAGGDPLPVRKPDGGHVSWVMDQLGVTDGAAIMVGDNHNDIAAARGAGIPVVAASYGYPHVPTAEMGADAIIDHFTELPTALDGLLDKLGRR
ncbi:phosphoglycolate phosphatase [Skermanella stibiiresistens SB22]|uniref:Phosphoglycolate phosphatase n=1 Tax=Skermanella stibiiresistens SB22 TaxID=1385369 RepID=W9GZZ5_9PROT|nr:phosphoglycolate phosphatase [Skermanella stibiiresistens]EWY38037.1 phosphoglycolate phosphatase [Skermanella stibiiresistens SB22]